MLIVINYHYVRPARATPRNGIHGVTPEEFEQQLQLLGRNGTFVDGARVLAALEGRGALPEPALLITFDDGLREQFDYALPVLDRLGVPALFFVNTRPCAENRMSTVHQIHLLRSRLAHREFLALLEDCANRCGIELTAPVDAEAAAAQYPFDPPEVGRLKQLLNSALPLEQRSALMDECFHQVYPGQEAELARQFYMSAGQMTALAERGWLGSHGHDHLPLARLEPEALNLNVQAACDLLAVWTGRRPFAMSYPYGTLHAISPEVAGAARRAGLRMGFTVEAAGNDAASLANPMFLARLDCNHAPGGRQQRWSAEQLLAGLPAARWYASENTAKVMHA